MILFVFIFMGMVGINLNVVHFRIDLVVVLREVLVVLNVIYSFEMQMLVFHK